MKPYEALAEAFELLNDDCDYPAWSQYFIAGLGRYGAGRKGLELGCGSGAFCRALVRAGYSMSGADRSEPMLTKAEALAAREGLGITFFRADAAALKTPEKYDFILSPNDCFNYVPPKKLISAFVHVAKCLAPKGIFWFDVSSAYKLREKVADNIFADDRDDVTYLSFNRLFEDRVETDVTLFYRRQDGAFDRFDEQHVEYIHETEALTAAVTAAGFELLAVEGHLGGPPEQSDRVNLICRKR